ncbi:MAG: PHP-associated domain-containing protein [Anaerolineaceae bacterium]|nr:PHP-associated domain-containing protein [Anaerolineaceae bacterium]
MTPLIAAEFHCHTVYSPDSLVSIEDLLSTCRQKDIGKIAITDHNMMAGAFKAKEMDPERVILAEEILTTQGELLGYFMTEPIQRGLAPEVVIEKLKKQGAFISVAHPFDPHRGSSWEPGTLARIMRDVDGVEVFNARCVRQAYNDEALAFAGQHQKLRMAGSDAHTLRELGRAALLMPPFENAEEMRAAVASAEIRAQLSGSQVHLFSTAASVLKKISGQK